MKTSCCLGVKVLIMDPPASLSPSGDPRAAGRVLPLTGGWPVLLGEGGVRLLDPRPTNPPASLKGQLTGEV